jgi:hypothetical protein
MFWDWRAARDAHRSARGEPRFSESHHHNRRTLCSWGHEKLNAALRGALAEPKIVKSFEQTDFSVFPEGEQTISAVNSLFHSEIQRWSQIVRENKLEAAQ